MKHEVHFNILCEYSPWAYLLCSASPESPPLTTDLGLLLRCLSLFFLHSVGKRTIYQKLFTKEIWLAGYHRGMDYFSFKQMFKIP